MVSVGGDNRPGVFWEQLVGEDSQPPGHRNPDLFAAVPGRVLRAVVVRIEGRGLLERHLGRNMDEIY